MESIIKNKNYKIKLILNAIKEYAILVQGWKIDEEDDYNNFKREIKRIINMKD